MKRKLTVKKLLIGYVAFVVVGMSIAFWVMMLRGCGATSKDAISITNMQWKELSSGYGITKISWKTHLKNNEPNPNHCYVEARFLDEDKMQVHMTNENTFLSAGETRIVTGIAVVKSYLIEDIEDMQIIVWIK